MAKSESPLNSSILTRILLEATEFAAVRKPFLAVFDLDSTLFDLHFRVSQIVDSFVALPENRDRFAEECNAMRHLQILRTDWGIGEALKRVGIDESRHREFWHELHKHWAAGFFSSDFLHHDEPLPGSVEYVRELQRLGAHVMYLTGRDEPRMLEGTRRSLLQRGFPVDEPNVRVVLKPKAGMDDAEFKLDVLRAESRRYSRIWLFENEPVNLNLVSRHLPEVGLVFIDSVHCGREEVADTLDRIVHFEVDLDEFRYLTRRN